MLATIWLQKVMTKCSIFNQTSDQPPASIPTKTTSKNVIWMRYQKKERSIFAAPTCFSRPTTFDFLKVPRQLKTPADFEILAGQVLEEIDQQGWNNMPLSCVSVENAL